MAKGQSESPEAKIAKELGRVVDETEAVKKLLILLLTKMGTTSEEIGTALTIDSSAIRRMVPSRGIKKFKFIANTDLPKKKSKK